MVYVVELLLTVGVPEIAPVDVSKERPFGSDGSTDQESTAPPLDVVVAVVMVVPFVNVSELGEYTTEGAISLT